MGWLANRSLNKNNIKTVHSFGLSVGLGLILFLMIILFAGCFENPEDGPSDQNNRYTITNNVPRIAMGGDGHGVIVWTRENHYFSSGRGGAGSIHELCTGGLAVTYCSPLTEDRNIWGYEYEAAVDSSGNTIVVWGDSQLADTVFMNRFDAASGAWQGKDTLTSPDTGGLSPRVSMNPSGVAMVTWLETVGENAFTLKSRYFNGTEWVPGGDVSSPAAVAAPIGAQSTQMVVFSDGSALAVWTQGTSGNYHLFSNSYTPGVGWGSPESRGIDITLGHGDVQMATNPLASGNRAVVAWRSEVPETTHWWGIYACIYQPGGWSDVEALSGGTDSNKKHQVAMDADGRAMVVWEGHSDYLFNRHIPGDGWQGMEILPGMGDVTGITPLRLAMGNDGTARVVADHYTVLFDPDEGWGALTTFDYPADDTVIATDATGHFMAAYCTPFSSTNPDNHVTRVIRTHTWGVPLAYFYANTYNPQAGYPVSFDAGASRDDDGTIESYEWDFGDGGTGTGEEISHIFSAAGTYVVTLTVTDDEGQSHSTSRTVTVALSPPVAEFTFSPTNPHSQEDVFFDASGSDDPDGTIVRYDWDFGGDEVLDAGVDPAYWFDNPGTYTVTLVVTDNDGLTAETSQTIAVGTQPPVAGYTFEPAAPTVGEEVTFTSTSTDDGTIVGYLWNFGDGATADTQNATHTYGAAGSYTVTLTVEDNEGNTAAAVGTVPVYGVMQYTLTVTYAGGCEGYVVSEPGGISETSSSAQFSPGTEVTLHPEPYSGCVFSHWGGDLSGAGDQSLVMDGDKQVEAWFE